MSFQEEGLRLPSVLPVLPVTRAMVRLFASSSSNNNSNNSSSNNNNNNNNPVLQVGMQEALPTAEQGVVGT